MRTWTKTAVNVECVEFEKNSFDIIRIVCAIIIFLGHFITHFDIKSPIAYNVAYFVRGVPVFFCISGFLVAKGLENYNTKKFLVKRFFRIYPALWTCVIINLLIILSVYSVRPNIKELFIYLASQLTVGQFYTGSWLSGYGVGVPNGALWTITTDIQFYIIAILLVKILKGKSLRIWMGTIVGAAGVSLGIERFFLGGGIVYKLLMVSVIPFLYIFLFGMMMYYFKDRLIPILIKFFWPTVVIYCIWMNLPPSIVVWTNGVRYNIVTSVILMCMVIGIAYRFGKHRVKTDYSYSFYLYHMVVINMTYHLIMKDFSSIIVAVVAFLIQFVIILILAYVSVNVIDKKINVPLERKIIKTIQ